jgi:hypothetical protein
MRLAALQAALVSAATGRDAPDAALFASLRAHRNASADERLAAYRANIKGAHLRALDQAYPVLREVLGPRYWRQLLEAELPFYGSPSPDLNAYGDFMPELLREAQRQRPELRDLPYLEALATLEWQVHRARFAADDAVFDWDAFATLPGDVQASARLLRSNALAVLQLDYRVDRIWRSHHGLDAGENDDTGDSYCCVHRSGRFDVSVTRLDREEFEMLQSLGSTPIGELSGAGTDALAQQLFVWIQRGWITGFEVDD